MSDRIESAIVFVLVNRSLAPLEALAIWRLCRARVYERLAYALQACGMESASRPGVWPHGE